MMMNVFALAAKNGEEMTFSERASTAGIVSLQGILTIFLVLTILWGAIELLHYALVGRKEKSVKESSAKKAVSSAPVAKETPADDAAIAAAIAAAMAASSDDGAVVAAITAAISEQLASEGYNGGFRVVSFKRVGRAKNRRA